MKITKEEMLKLIRQKAAANGGKPVGKERFEAETGIREHEWQGLHWIRWSDAVREAGFSANEMGWTRKMNESHLLTKLVLLIRELGHFPVGAELKLKRNSDP